MSDQLRVRVAEDLATLALQPAPKLQVVFDDPVVDERDGARDVGVSVYLRGATVRGPAGVADPSRSWERVLPKRRVEVPQLPHGSQDVDATLAVYGQPGGVISAVLEAPKAIEQDRAALARSHVADDSTHVFVPVPSRAGARHVCRSEASACSRPHALTILHLQGYAQGVSFDSAAVVSASDSALSGPAGCAWSSIFTRPSASTTVTSP